MLIHKQDIIKGTESSQIKVVKTGSTFGIKQILPGLRTQTGVEDLKSTLKTNLKKAQTHLSDADTESLVSSQLIPLLALGLNSKTFTYEGLFDGQTFNQKQLQEWLKSCPYQGFIKLALHFDDEDTEMDAATVVFYQQIPEIYELFTNHFVFSVKSELQTCISECIQHILNGEHQNINLTEAKLTAKIAWCACDLLIRVALNTVSMSIGGIILDSIHTVLNTHGSSSFDLTKKMVPVDGDGSKVAVRTSPSADNIPSLTQALAQFGSDIADESITGAIAKIQSSTFKKIQQATVSIKESRQGTKFDRHANSTVFGSMLEPISRLQKRVMECRLLIRLVIIDVVEKKLLEGLNLNDLGHLEIIANEVKLRLEQLKVHAYLTYLTQLAIKYAKVYSWKDYYKALMAEILCEHSEKVVDSDQVLSTDLWTQLFNYDLAINKPIETPSMPNVDQSTQCRDTIIGILEEKCGKPKSEWYGLWNNKYKKVMQGNLVVAVHEYYKLALDGNYITVSANQKYGDRSTIATLATATQLTTDKNNELQQKIEQLDKESGYIAFTQLVGVPGEAKTSWDAIKERLDGSNKSSTNANLK